VSKVRVFLVDDHPIVREGLKALLAAEVGLDVIGEAADGVTAYECIREMRPDVAIVDLSLPGLNGLRITEQLVRECPGVNVLILTVHEDTGHLRQLLAAGARGYVLKRSAGDSLIHAVRVVAAGGVYLDSTLAARLVTGAGNRQQADKPPLGEVELSDREVEVVRATAAGFSNKEIAAQLDLSVKTVETYRTRAMEKLHLKGRPALVRYAIQRGWLQSC
jgi:DNA-binding NarL/FixJ family response regulator